MVALDPNVLIAGGVLLALLVFLVWLVQLIGRGRSSAPQDLRQYVPRCFLCTVLPRFSGYPG